MNAANPARPVPPRRPSAKRWPLLVVGLLVTHASLMTSVVVIAQRDNRDAVVRVKETTAAADMPVARTATTIERRP